MIEWSCPSKLDSRPPLGEESPGTTKWQWVTPTVRENRESATETILLRFRGTLLKGGKVKSED